MPVEVIQEPLNSAFDLSEVKRQLFIEEESTEHDTYLEFLMDAIVHPIQRHYNRQLITATFMQTLTKWKREVWLRSPVQSITKVEYAEAKDTVVEFDPAEYELIKTQRQDYIHFTGFLERLADSSEVKFPLVITYKTGYGDTHEDVPKDIKLFAYQVMSMMYGQREPVSEQKLYDVIDMMQRQLATKRVFRFQ